MNTIKCFEVPSALDPDNQSEPVVVGVVVGKFDNIIEPKEPVDIILELILPVALILIPVVDVDVIVPVVIPCEIITFSPCTEVSVNYHHQILFLEDYHHHHD